VTKQNISSIIIQNVYNLYRDVFFREFNLFKDLYRNFCYGVLSDQVEKTQATEETSLRYVLFVRHQSFQAKILHQSCLAAQVSNNSPSLRVRI